MATNNAFESSENDGTEERTENGKKSTETTAIAAAPNIDTYFSDEKVHIPDVEEVRVALPSVALLWNAFTACHPKAIIEWLIYGFLPGNAIDNESSGPIDFWTLVVGAWTN